MRDLDRRRHRFMIEIKRESKQEYFKSRREMLLNHPPHPEQEDLYQIIKTSLVKNALLPLIRQNNLIEQLKDEAVSGSMIKCRQTMVICANALLDDLQLTQKQEISELLLRLYRLYGTMSGAASADVANTLASFAGVLPDLRQEVAADGEAMVCQLVMQVIQRAIPQPPSEQLCQEVCEALRGLQALLVGAPEYLQFLEGHFSRNILFYNALLQLHPQLCERAENSHCLIIREAMLRLFRRMSIEITLNRFPMVYEGEAFCDFLFEEILAARNTKWEQMALDTMANLIIDYEQCECSQLMKIFTSSSDRLQAFFRRLLFFDSVVQWRLKMLKTLLGKEKFYGPMKELFDDHWRDVIDVCIDAMRSSQALIILKHAVETMILLTEWRKDEAYVNYLRNQGTQYLMEHLHTQLDQKGRQEKGQEEGNLDSIQMGLNHMLNQIGE